MNTNIVELIKNTSSVTWVTNPKSADKWRYFTTKLKISDSLSDLYVLSIDSSDLESANDIMKKMIDHQGFELIGTTNMPVPDENLSHEWLCKSDQWERIIEICKNKSKTIPWFEENCCTIWECYDKSEEIFTRLNEYEKRYIIGIDTGIIATVLKKNNNQCIFLSLDNISFWGWCKANELKLQSILITNPFESGIVFNEDKICDSLGISERYIVPSTISEYIDNIYFDKDADSFEIYGASFEFEEYRYFIDLIKNHPINYYDIAKILRCRNLPQEIVILIKSRLIEIISIKEPYEFEIAALLNGSYITEDMMTFIQRIIDAEFYNDLESFYVYCVGINVELITLQYIKDSDFVRWSEEHQVEMIAHICSRIIEGDSFLHVPDFLKKERDILMAFVQIYWEYGTEEERDVFKEIAKESGFSGDLDFILYTLKYDDGSISLVIADKSILNSSEYWIKCALAWKSSPREGFLEPKDYEIYYSGMPKIVKADLVFNKNLISEIPHFIHALNDSFKENHEICGLALAQDGMLLQFLSEKIKNNEDLAAIAISQNSKAVEFISDDLTYEVSFIKRVIGANPKALEYCIPRVKHLYQNG